MTRQRMMMAGGGVFLILLAIITVLVFGPDKPDAAPPPTGPCAGVALEGAAPIRSDLAFGPDVRTEIPGFEQLSPEGKLEAVRAHQASAWCRFPAVALANAMHRGVRPWPASAEEWSSQLQVLMADVATHHQLVKQLETWEAANVASYELAYNASSYQSDWFDRTSGRPVLVRGMGHDTVGGDVIRRVLKDGSVLDERLVCFYQLAGPVPESVPTGGGGQVPPGTTTPPVTTVPTTAPCGDKSSGRLPDGTCGVSVTTVPRSPTTATPASTTRPTTPPTAPPETVATGTTLTSVPTPSTVQDPDGPPVTATAPSTSAPPATAPPGTVTGTVPRPT